MKVVFVGPTLPDAPDLAGDDIAVRPPARQGDILEAVRQGANVIGLVDGNFEHVAPIWHKEILHALSQGVKICGAASMGALRAAECSPYGMEGVGSIYRQYERGEILDDADVAQLHAPRELRYFSISVPMVNVVATLKRLYSEELIDRGEAEALEEAARAIFFKERTYQAVTDRAVLTDMRRKAEILEFLPAFEVNQKRLDALELLRWLASAQNIRTPVTASWSFNSTSMWKTAFHN
ncbi:antibiotic resistance protein [Phyllobacterium salinisoli]|uniref:Antibiotic resistance protein n=1 Tax=Phyllobacterium salinisoli TaxID=1899321 RepID=A0A368K2P7_9HYPH|nr:TfuA-like protein [Phyllobacterium salinisoli]RCS23491.1 antibiotic resistance protein [Phyllobacterium salinisoli]